MMDIHTKKGLGRYLANIRLERKLTQWDVAVALGYGTPQFVSNWERGVVLPSLKESHRLAGLLRLPERDLIGAVFAVKQYELETEYQNMIGDIKKKRSTKIGKPPK